MYTEDSQIAIDANYTLSLIPVLKVIDKELGNGVMLTYNLTDHDDRSMVGCDDIPKIDWSRLVPSVLPEGLRYIVESKQYEVEKDKLISEYLSLPYGNHRRLRLEFKLKRLGWI